MNEQKRYGCQSMTSEGGKGFKKTEVVTVCSAKKNLEYETGEFLRDSSQEVSNCSVLVLMIEILLTSV